MAKKKAWVRPDGDDLSVSPSTEVDDPEIINEWLQSLKEDKELWPRGWQVTETPAIQGFFIDSYGAYLQKGEACIDPLTKDEYYWHCLATAQCRRRK